MTNQTEAIIARIREVCPELMELSFGCEITVAGIARDNPGCERDWVLYGTQEQRDKGFVPTEYYGEVPISEIERIIGHPVHLEHLLRAVQLRYMNGTLQKEGEFKNIMEWYGEIVYAFDLTLTVSENLEKNEELREFIYSLICKV